MIFLYQCLNKKCKDVKGEPFQFEFHHIPRTEPAVCPRCAGTKVEKQFAPKTTHILKGSGWAKDNYGLKKKK